MKIEMKWKNKLTNWNVTQDHLSPKNNTDPLSDKINWHEHWHCSSGNDVFQTLNSMGIISKYCRHLGMSVNIAVGESHNETSAVG